jgi:limonene-1,2-epoxide hydrolase
MSKAIYDVIVAGGGPGGVSAAIAAARKGAKTLLIEQEGYLGGALTACGTGPQMAFHAGKVQVVRGIAEEIIQTLIRRGESPGHMEDFVGYTSSVTPFDAEGMKVVMETMAMEAGTELLYHTVCTGCEVQGGRITRLRLYSKGGFFDVSAKVYIDATADADLSVYAGVPTEYGRERDQLAQPMTTNMKLYGVDRERLIDYILANQEDMLPTMPFARLRLIPRTGIQGGYSRIEDARKRGEFSIDRDQVLCFETNNPGEFIVNMTRVLKHSAIDPVELTLAEVEGRRQCHEVLAFLRNYIPGFSDSVLASTGPSIGVRESRRIQGVYRLTVEDLQSCRMFDDAVSMGGYPVDIHSPDGRGMDHTVFAPDSWYSIPYRSLLSERISNLIVAGRCISATHEAAAAIRITPILMGYSQGAGTAAAIAAKTDGNTLTVDVSALRETLEQDGVFLQAFS